MGTQIEHAPRQAIVACDIAGGHIGELNHSLRIMGADDWIIRSAAAAGTEYLPAFRILPLRETGKRGKKQHNRKN